MFKALIEMKKLTPRYCRISRLIRDIPTPDIEAGNIITNLREYLSEEMKKQGTVCQCLRCREIGHNKDLGLKTADLRLFIDTYETAGGTEYFLSFEDPKRQAVFAFLRLRIPSEKNDKMEKYLPETKDVAFIRELHTYGQLVDVGKQNKKASQHKGMGKKLVKEAERIAEKNGFEKLAVISGVGVRGYYRKIGYKKRGTYMIKKI